MVIRARSRTGFAKPRAGAARSPKSPDNDTTKSERLKRRGQSEELKSRLKKLMGEGSSKKSKGPKTSKKTEKKKRQSVKETERKLQENLQQAEQLEEQARNKAERKTVEAGREKAVAQDRHNRAELKAAESDACMAQARATVEQLRSRAESSSTQDVMAQLTRAETALAQAGVAHAGSITEKLKAGALMDGALELGARAKGEATEAGHAKAKLEQARQMARRPEKPPTGALQLSRQTALKLERFQAGNASWIQGALKGPAPLTPARPTAAAPGPAEKPLLPRSGGPGPQRGFSPSGVGNSLPYGSRRPPRPEAPHHLAAPQRGRPPEFQPPSPDAHKRHNQAAGMAHLHRARKLRKQGRVEEAERAEERARTAVFRAQQNAITADGAVQKRQNALIAGQGIDPESAPAREQKQRVLDQFQTLPDGPPPLSGVEPSSTRLGREAERRYDQPPKRWDDPRRLSARKERQDV